MVHKIKKILYQSLSLEHYLKLLQKSYFVSYKTGLLKLIQHDIYQYHYYVRNLIHRGDVVIDIGSNLGYYTAMFSKWIGSSGTVYSVEPIPIYQKLQREMIKRSYSSLNIKWLPFALGRQEKKIIMVTDPSLDYLSTGLFHVYDPQKDGDIRSHALQFEVSMKNPLSLFSGLERIDYIKCDVEGYEMIVLSEMVEIFKKHRPIVQVEVWRKNKAGMYRFFSEMGYRPAKLQRGKLVPDSYDEKGNGGDCLFFHESIVSRYL